MKQFIAYHSYLEALGDLKLSSDEDLNYSFSSTDGEIDYYKVIDKKACRSLYFVPIFSEGEEN